MVGNLRLSTRTSKEDQETKLWKHFREIKEERTKPESLINVRERVPDISFILAPIQAKSLPKGKIPAEMAQEVLTKVREYANAPRSLYPLKI